MVSYLHSTTTALKKALPVSRTALLDYCEKVLANGLVDVIDSHNTNSAIFIFQHGLRKYVLKVEYGQNNATSREINWYQALSSHPISLAPQYVDAFSNNYLSFLILTYIDNAITLEDIVNTDKYPVEKVLGYIAEVLEKDVSLYILSRPRTVARDAIERRFMKKFAERRKQSSQYPYLKSLFNSDTVAINGIKMPTPAYYICRIANDDALHAYLTPTSVGLIHGDLHCGNVLVNEAGVYFVDPNGSLYMPIEYDYGKLLHSVHGAYDQIMHDKYSLKDLGGHDFEFTVRVTSKHKAAFICLQDKLTDQDMLRGLYAEAMHFATMLPHHAANRQETTALFLRSIELFAELFEKLDMEIRT